MLKHIIILRNKKKEKGIFIEKLIKDLKLDDDKKKLFYF